jgi:hypothetical protein
MKPRLSDAERANAPPIPRLGDPLTLLSPDAPTKPGEELYLTYGAHPNRTLFVEYGFVVSCTPDDPRAEVDIQDIVEPLFEDKGIEGVIKKKMLQDAGYWGYDLSAIAFVPLTSYYQILDPGRVAGRVVSSHYCAATAARSFG